MPIPGRASCTPSITLASLAVDVARALGQRLQPWWHCRGSSSTCARVQPRQRRLTSNLAPQVERRRCWQGLECADQCAELLALFPDNHVIRTPPQRTPAIFGGQLRLSCSIAGLSTVMGRSSRPDPANIIARPLRHCRSDPPEVACGRSCFAHARDARTVCGNVEQGSDQLSVSASTSKRSDKAPSTTKVFLPVQAKTVCLRMWHQYRGWRLGRTFRCLHPPPAHKSVSRGNLGE